MRFPAALIGFVLVLAPSLADAQVRVQGYTRSDGTYVRPHIRSAPDNSVANNYGASRSSPLYSPSLPDLSVVTASSRDHDRDGVANMYDVDDDNDGVADDYDRDQYGTVGGVVLRYRYGSSDFGRDMRDSIRESYNQTLTSARADGRITAYERSELDFWRRAYDLYR